MGKWSVGEQTSNGQVYINSPENCECALFHCEREAVATVRLLNAADAMREALTEARRELSNYTRGDMGGENRSVTSVIEMIDAALAPTSERTSDDA